MGSLGKERVSEVNNNKKRQWNSILCTLLESKRQRCCMHQREMYVLEWKSTVDFGFYTLARLCTVAATEWGVTRPLIYI